MRITSTAKGIAKTTIYAGIGLVVLGMLGNFGRSIKARILG